MAEVYFYFYLDTEDDNISNHPSEDEGLPNNKQEAFALVSIIGRPDPELLEWSSYTFWSCTLTGDEGLAIIDVKDIEATVAIIPHETDIIDDPGLRARVRGRWYMAPELGANAGTLAGAGDVDEDLLLE